MGNKIKTVYRNVNLLYESFNPPTGVFVITCGFWHSVDEYSEEWKREVLWMDRRFRHGKYADNSIILWTSHLQEGFLARWKREGTTLCYQEFQVTIKLRTPTVLATDLKTFKANLETIKPDVERFIDDVFKIEDAPTPYAKKKEAG